MHMRSLCNDWIGLFLCRDNEKAHFFGLLRDSKNLKCEKNLSLSAIKLTERMHV